MGLSWAEFAELWRYRELGYFLGLRDLQVRYRQAFLGLFWALLQPLLTMTVFAVFFGHLGGLSRTLEGGVSYSVFLLVGLVPWFLFSQGLGAVALSMVGSQGLVTKVYFPRMLIPLAAMTPGVVDFAVGSGMLLVVSSSRWQAPLTALAAVPLVGILTALITIGVGLWLSALNVAYRDVRHVLPLLMQVWMLASPIAYPSSIVPDGFGLLYGLNPMASVIEGFRWALLGTSPPALPLVAAGGTSTLLLLVGGAWYFKRSEREFADVV